MRVPATCDCRDGLSHVEVVQQHVQRWSKGVYAKVAATPAQLANDPKTAHPSSERRQRKRARAVALAETHAKAVERLERASQRVRALEAGNERADGPDALAELERARAVVRKVERRLEVLARRRARAERKLNGPSAS
jgi:hypothetical protein